jgi:hypothetical protein
VVIYIVDYRPPQETENSKSLGHSHNDRPRAERHLPQALQLAARELDIGLTTPHEAAMAVSLAGRITAATRAEQVQGYARVTVKDDASRVR